MVLSPSAAVVAAWGRTTLPHTFSTSSGTIQVKATGLGLVTISGTGGNGSGNNNDGVYVGSGTEVSAVTGGISITGSGQGSGTHENGVAISQSGTVSATPGNFSCSIQGTGSFTRNRRQLASTWRQRSPPFTDGRSVAKGSRAVIASWPS